MVTFTFFGSGQLHGTEDAVIPWSHSQELFEAAKEPRSLWILEGAIHTGLHNHAPDEWERRYVGPSRAAS